MLQTQENQMGRRLPQADMTATNKFRYRLIFTVCFGFVYTLLSVALMNSGVTPVEKYAGYFNFIAFFLWLSSLRILPFGGLWSYYVLVLIQWLLIGSIVSLLIRKKKISKRIEPVKGRFLVL